MERWVGKVAVVTGASSGIGAAIAVDLTRAGLLVIGLARRVHRLEELKNQLKESKGEFHYHECDTSSLQSIKTAFEWINLKFNGRLHVLVNNAGVGKATNILTENNEDQLKSLLDTNVMGYIYCIKESYKIMKTTGQECVIINIGSVLGKSVPHSILTQVYNMYPSSKHAICAAGDVLRQELLEDPNFRVTTINPGIVRTEILEVAKSLNKDGSVSLPKMLNADDISQTVLFVLKMPQHVEIADITIKPKGETF